MWVGGKRILAKRIVGELPEHRCYVEAFAGAGWVLFAKDPKASTAEVLNDRDGELVNLYRVVKEDIEALAEAYDWVLVSREVFDHLKKADVERLGRVERAARFFYLMKHAFGGRMRSPSFGTGTERPPGDPRNAVEALREAHDRLCRVVIENLDFEALLARYDRPQTCFYLDPPFYETGRDYRCHFEYADHERLARVLAGVKGKWLLSYNDHKVIRGLYAGFKVTSLAVKYSIHRTRSVSRRELLIRNF